MNWPDERYVKFYVRDTYTWRSWPWEARALLGPLMKAMNGAGIIEIGNASPAEAIGVMVLLPTKVVEVGMAAMIGTGTLERIPRGFLMPNFLEAQEARKTEAAKKMDQRDRARDIARAQEAGILSPHVPPCPTESQHVPLQPSPAQPSPKSIVEQAQPKATKEAQEVFEHWRTVMRKPKALFIGKRLRAVEGRLRDGYSVLDLKAAIDGFSKTAFVNDKGVVFNDLELICRDATHVERDHGGLLRAAPPTQAGLSPTPENWS